MEFLRFGSSIPGSYYGCCAVDIIQQMNVDPDAPASIQVVDGDSGTPVSKNGQHAYLGKTNREVFLARLRIGTFGRGDMPNHAFFVVLTENQLRTPHGMAWLKILKEQGFEFLRCVDNSVYTGSSLADKDKRNPHKNYIFALFRNVGAGSVDDMFAPPKEWTDLKSVVPEPWERLPDRPKLTTEIFDSQMPLYKALPPVTYYSAQQLLDAGVTPMLAGVRSTKPPRPYVPKVEKPKSAPFTAPAPALSEATA